MFMSPRSPRFAAFFLGLSVAVGAPSALAQVALPPVPDVDRDGDARIAADGRSQDSREPWQEYGKFIQKRAGVTALGPDAFGESVSLYNGALSFSVTDINVPGNSALAVALTRTFEVRDRPIYFLFDRPMADWDLDLPRISGTYGPTWQNQRCTDTNGAPTVFGAYTRNDYWQGLQASIPSGGELLLHRPNQTPATPRPSSGGPYVWVTPGLSYISCLTAIQNAPGEGFLAITPDGTTYRFDWMAQYYEGVLARPISANGPNVGPLTRRVNVMYATQVTDRFGNWVSYSYANAANQPARLTRIEANDGRIINLSYNAGGQVQSASSAGQTHTYTYNAAGSSLASVVLPDNSRWTINFKGLADANIEYMNALDPRMCDTVTPVVDASVAGAVTHPAGATATYTVKAQRHGRTNVPKVCTNYSFPNDPNDDVAYFIRDYWAFSLMQKTVSGAALADLSSPEALRWVYDYQSQRSWIPSNLPPVCPNEDCADPVCLLDDCAGTAQTTVDGPGEWMRHTFGNSYRYDEGKLRKVERGSSANAILQTDTTHYVLEQSGQAFAASIGASLRPRGDGFASEYPRPRQEHLIARDGATFTWAATRFDAFLRPTVISRASSLPGGAAISQAQTYYDDISKWVINQPRTLTANSQQVQSKDYQSASALPERQFAFGQRVATYAYDQLGLLTTVIDGRNQPTHLSEYKRGLPQIVAHSDGTQESVAINDHGWITAYTNASGQTNQYAYDAMGRLTQITPPSEPGLKYFPTTYSFYPSTTSAYGLPVSHWQLREQTGNRVSIQYFDALLQPVVSRTAILNGGSETDARFIVRRFDYAGREVFSSDPLSSLGNYLSASAGTYKTYDALGRITTQVQSSEIGPLTTQYEYLNGFATRMTNPRGNQTTQQYQAFDDPSGARPISIITPTNTTSISRDIYGNALTMTRSGIFAGQAMSSMRRYVYDAQQRLCKRIEPETGASVYEYDAADNMIWSAEGLNLPSDNCDRELVAFNQKTQRSYDSRGRMTFIDYPSPTIDWSATYTTDGLQNTVSRGSAVWIYQYNNRRLLTQETLNYNGVRSYQHGYDGYGNRSQLTYPSGETVAFAPNAYGEATRVGDLVTNATYHVSGKLQSYQRSNGIHHSRIYNQRLMPSIWRDTGLTNVLDLTQSYDANGNLSAVSDAIFGAENKQLKYDGADRLTQVRGSPVGANADFTYDPLDRMRVSARLTQTNTPQQTFTHSYNSNHQLADVNIVGSNGPINIAFQHDSRGRMTQTGTAPLNYDHANQMIALPGIGESYQYDGHGRRIAISSGITNSARYPIYSQNGQLLNEYGSNGAVITYYYPGNQLIAQRNNEAAVDQLYRDGFENPTRTPGNANYNPFPPLITPIHDAYPRLQSEANAAAEIRGSTTVITYLHTDYLGSVIAESNAQGQLLKRHHRTAYGESLSAAPGNGPGYTGHVNDANSGLVYAQQRYYQPALAAFLIADPVAVGTTAGGNYGRYYYGNNNPFMFVDPDGRLPTLVPILIFVAKEIASEAVEQATGVPIPSAKNVGKAVVRQLAREGRRDGVQGIATEGVKGHGKSRCRRCTCREPAETADRAGKCSEG